MQRNIRWILLLTIVFSNRLLGQSIKKIESKDFFISPKNDTIFSTTYIVQNDTKMDLFLWFDAHRTVSQSDNIKHYFYKTNGEVSLYEILNDESVRDKRLNIFGQTFITLIKPKGRFQIFSTAYKKNEKTDSNIGESLVIVNPMVLSQTLKKMLYENREYFYQASFIVIPILND